MFWGITLDVGKRYTQTVEKSFHLSMAALGFNNTTADPVTVMVEVDKAHYALCTLQPGKIPQQTLDIAFTEGEEITFYTEGNNEVHLTGYLVEEPETIEMDEEENYSMDSDESVSGSDKSASDSNEDESSSSDVITLQHLLVGENVSDDDQSDNDWDPLKDNPVSKVKHKNGKKSKKNDKNETESAQSVAIKEENVSNGRAEQQTARLTTINDALDKTDEESDEYIPEKKNQQSNKKLKKKGKKRKFREGSDDSSITQQNEPAKAKKYKKRTPNLANDS